MQYFFIHVSMYSAVKVEKFAPSRHCFAAFCIGGTFYPARAKGSKERSV